MRHAAESPPCRCGHGAGLHDRYGCAAYLGSFPETASELAYCPCQVASAEPLSLGAEHRSADDRVVATVRVRARGGSAIAVCEEPAALELGATAEQVLERIKDRLREAIAPGDGSVQLVVIMRERGDAAAIEVDTLR
jgi:hypothetical protein